MSSLRDSILGSWRLLSFTAVRVSPKGDEHDTIYPMSQHAIGSIIYTPDGYMSGQIMLPGAKPLSSGNPLTAAVDELADAARHFISYTGPFDVSDGEPPIVTHTVQLASFPNIVGELQQRIATLEDGAEGKVLTLKAEPPTVMGEERILVWKWGKVAK